MLELSVTLRRNIIDYLMSLPNVDDTRSQRAFILSVGLDPQLQGQILFGESPAQFVPPLVSQLLKYGKLNDGRYAIIAVLEASKNYIGQDRKAYCETLIQELQAINSQSPSQVLDTSITKQGMVNTPQVENLSQSQIGSLIRVFTRKVNKLFEPADEELEELYEFKAKLYKQIFKQFDDKLKKIPHLKEKHPGILFNRLLSSEKLEKIDIDTITAIRRQKEYLWYERSIVVNVLGISLLNKFDRTKIHLLIDFLTDFEDNVWQKSLVGLLIGLSYYENHISLFPDIINRLERLQEIPQIQEGFIITERILRKEFYKLSKMVGACTDAQIMSKFEKAYNLVNTITGTNTEEKSER